MSTSETVVQPARTSPAGRAWKQRRWSLVRVCSPLLLVLWQIFSATGVIPQDVLPAPQLSFAAGLELIYNGKLSEAPEVSGLRVLEGLLLGGLVGTALGVAVGTDDSMAWSWGAAAID